MRNAGGYYGGYNSIVPYQNYGSLTGGGYVNPRTGAGGTADKSESGFFIPTWWNNRYQLETLYVQSWAARKFINILVDDMFIRWREFEDMAERTIKRYKEGESQHFVKSRLSMALKAGRLYGTSFLVMMTTEAPMDTPLIVENLRQGDLSNLMVLDRYNTSVTYDDYDADPFSPSYERPLRYRFHLRYGPQMVVDATRVIRFDGISPLNTQGWDSYEREWGVSEIVPVLLAIMQDASVASSTAHLTTESSIPVIKLPNLRDVLAGDNPDPDELTPDQMGERINRDRSVFRTTFLDALDDYMRVNVSFAGLPDVLNQYALRLAAAADIPATRFMGRSPVGMNATGESDMTNYAIRIAALQNSLLTDPLRKLDAVLGRHTGVNTEGLEYKWPSLVDMSEMDQATIAKIKSEAIAMLVAAFLLNENEARGIVDGDPIIGHLSPASMQEIRARRQQMMASQSSGQGSGQS